MDKRTKIVREKDFNEGDYPTIFNMERDKVEMQGFVSAG